MLYPYTIYAAWFGFAIAGYSAIANDSIQTIGTFLSSNSHRKWWILWIWLSLIFLATVLFSWITYHGDVSHQRLIAKGFEQSPKHFAFLQIAAPIVLLILTRAGMPVSTTFFLLSSFAASGAAIGKVLFKSLSGYFVAFAVAFVIYNLIARLSKKWFVGTPSAQWVIAQWLVSGMLWSIWLQQDLANIAVFLPRALSIYEFALFSGYIILGLGVLLYLKGGAIQTIVTEKSNVTDPRFATIIDGIYALVLWYFKIISKIPMSTTWVFLGLLAGREIAMVLQKTADESFGRSLRMVGKDVSYALIGLVISIAIAIWVNPSLHFVDIPGQAIKEVGSLVK